MATERTMKLRSNGAATRDKVPAPHELLDMSNAVRALAMDAVERAQSGHPGMPMGMADVATILFSEFLKFDPACPDWPDRDRFVLSAGHGSMLLYALLYLTGYPNTNIQDLMDFRQLGSKTAGHPELGHMPGIETTTGPLGQGLANAVGMSLAEKLLGFEFGEKLVDHHTYVMAGDGCLMEGISQEAISFAGHLKLNKLVVLFDDNGISIDGPTSLATSEDHLQRFAAAGWATRAVSGHDFDAIRAALQEAKTSDRPSLIAFRTIIGFGSPRKAGTAACHGSPLGRDEIAATRATLGWHHPPFAIPDDILASWRRCGARGAKARAAWDRRLAAATAATHDEFVRRAAGDLPGGWRDAISRVRTTFRAKGANKATRASSQDVLDELVTVMPELLGGSADLTGSNNTRAKGVTAVAAASGGGRYIHYGVREHAMAAVMNGIALHRGYIPFGGTFLVFSDYCRPAIRLSAIMGQRVIHVMTHDSIGLGEDGPTHQPVEHLATLRAIPNLTVLRPADAVETAECWEVALLSTAAPTLLSLSRQNLPLLRQDDDGENRSAAGGYVLAEATGLRQVTLIGSGSEVAIAMRAREILNEQGICAAVVSMPGPTLFARLDGDRREAVLGEEGHPRVVVEAGLRLGWEAILGSCGAFVGMTNFGASGPAPELYAHFAITAERVAEVAAALVGRRT